MSRLIQGPDPRVWGSRDNNQSGDPDVRQMRREISSWLESDWLPLSYQVTFQSLLKEKNPEIFCLDLTRLAQAAVQAGNIQIAWELNQLLAEHAPDPIVRNLATRNQIALWGPSSTFAEKLEMQTGRFLTESTRPATLLAMVGAGWAYRTGRMMGLRWGPRLGDLSLSAKLSQSTVPPILGFSMEVPAYVCGEKLMAQAWGQRVSWDHWSEEMGQTALLFGAMKWGGRAGAGMRSYFKQRGLDGTFMGTLWSHGGLLAGLELGARLGNEVDRSFFDNLVLLLQFSAAQGLLGPLSKAHGGDMWNFGLGLGEFAKPWFPGRPPAFNSSLHPFHSHGLENRSFMVSHDGKGPPGGPKQKVRKQKRFLKDGRWLSSKELLQFEEIPSVHRSPPSLEGLIVEMVPGRKVLLQEAQKPMLGAELWTLTEIRYKKLILTPTEELGQVGARRMEISHKLWQAFGAQQGKQFVAIPYLEPRLTSLLRRPPQEFLQRLEQNRMTHRELKSLLEEATLNLSHDHRTAFYQWNPWPWFHQRRADPHAVALIHQLHHLKHPLASDLLARTDFSYFTSKQVQQNQSLLRTLALTQKIIPENYSARQLWRELPEPLRAPYEGFELDPK